MDHPTEELFIQGSNGLAVLCSVYCVVRNIRYIAILILKKISNSHFIL